MTPTDRRAFLGASLAALAAAVSPALAAPLDGSLGEPEWRQSYDAGQSRVRAVRSSAPILSAATYEATEAAVGSLRAVASQGGFLRLGNAGSLKLGSQGPAVVALRQRLMQGGDLEPGDASATFDSYVEAGVKRAQLRHGLSPTGVVGKETLAALNVPAEVRLRQLETNLVRLRSLSGNLGERFVTVNIPAAYVETVEGGRVATRHAAGVGKMDRQSPIMNAKIVEINFNPTWTVPASIIRKDLIPKMQADPNYLTDNKIRIINGAGQEIPPTSVNWRSDEATRYMFRQDSGGEVNSLGFIRINIPNPHGVYMHDTPAKGIFGEDFRFVSSGCVRVQNVRDYVAWILKDNPAWNRDAIDDAIRSGKRIDARPAAAIPAYWVYITAWATPEGAIQFRDDIYGRDGVGPGAVTAAMQAAPAAPAGQEEE